MLLFQKRFHEGLVSGAVTLTFRRWAQARVRPGGRYRCHPIGVLEVDAVSEVRVADITDDDARRTGFEGRAALIDYLKTANDAPLRATTKVFRIALHHGGDGDRVQLALADQLTPEDIAAIVARLARLDARTPWTREVLACIEAQPRVAASRLAAQLGRETLPLKVDIRKLKALGLTQSFEVGYEISPRGRAFLDATRVPARKKRAARTPTR
ncbi:MAG: hypothetical protein ABW252_22135 [Polyangiales bacterium]